MSPEIHSHVARNFYRFYFNLACQFVFKGRVWALWNFGRHDYKFRATWLWFRATWLWVRWLSGDLTVKLSRRGTREAWAPTLFLGQTEAWSVVIGLPVGCPVIKWKEFERLGMKTTILLAVFYQKTTGARFLDSVPCNASQKKWFLEFSLLFVFRNTVKWTCPISITNNLSFSQNGSC